MSPLQPKGIGTYLRKSSNIREVSQRRDKKDKEIQNKLIRLSNMGDQIST